MTALKPILKLSSLLFLLLFFACAQNSSPEESTEVTTTTVEKISTERTEVKKQPVETYDEKLDDELNDWHFTVSLRETKKRFNYLVNVQYEEMIASDTIRFPNFGTEPQPKIQKGAKPHECIIGFLDREGNFREYVKVSAENDRLKIKTIRHYSVTEK